MPGSKNVGSARGTLNVITAGVVLMSSISALMPAPAAAFYSAASTGGPVYHHSGMGGREQSPANSLSESGGYHSPGFGGGYGSEYGANGYAPRSGSLVNQHLGQ